MQRVILLLKIISSLFILGLIGALGFSLYVINEAPIEIFSRVISESSENGTGPERNYLEQGSGTDIESLKNYILFSDYAGTFRQWKKEHQGKFKVFKKKSFSFTEKIGLPFPVNNECEIVYCFQKRIKFEKIPPIFWKGLIGIEDERFLLHGGIDLKSLMRAFIHDIKVMRLEQGGSTLTQQIIKNLFYTNEKKISRKLKEMVLAVYLESKFEKEKILEAYFNEVVWGGKQGIKIKGLFAASLFYFSKKPEHVSPYEAAILISLLKGPNYYNPLRKKDRLRSRADLVYKKLVNMNLFPPEKNEKWDEARWKNWITILKRKQELKPYRSNWWLSVHLDKGELGIYERYVFHRKVLKRLSLIKDRLERRDIAVKAYFGDLKSENRYFYYSKYERNWEKAKKIEKHTLGSTIKPLIYSLFLDLGIEMNEEVDTGPLLIKLKSGVWKPREAHKIKIEKITLEEALKKSFNRPIIRKSQEIGFDEVEKKLLELFPSIKKPLAEYPAQLLGTVEVSLEKLFLIYKGFIEKECRRDGANIVKILSDPKETTIRKLVGPSFGNLEFFGKTGTSNNGFDNWFIFYEGNRLGVIWTGLEGKRSGGDLKLYGGTTSFKIFKDLYINSGRRFGEFICGSNISI